MSEQDTVDFQRRLVEQECSKLTNLDALKARMKQIVRHDSDQDLWSVRDTLAWIMGVDHANGVSNPYRLWTKRYPWLLDDIEHMKFGAYQTTVMSYEKLLRAIASTSLACDYVIAGKIAELLGHGPPFSALVPSSKKEKKHQPQEKEKPKDKKQEKQQDEKQEKDKSKAKSKDKKQEKEEKDKPKEKEKPKDKKQEKQQEKEEKDKPKEKEKPKDKKQEKQQEKEEKDKPKEKDKSKDKKEEKDKTEKTDDATSSEGGAITRSQSRAGRILTVPVHDDDRPRRRRRRRLCKRPRSPSSSPSAKRARDRSPSYDVDQVLASARAPTPTPTPAPTAPATPVPPAAPVVPTVPVATTLRPGLPRSDELFFAEALHISKTIAQELDPDDQESQALFKQIVKSCLRGVKQAVDTRLNV